MRWFALGTRRLFCAAVGGVVALTVSAGTAGATLAARGVVAGTDSSSSVLTDIAKLSSLVDSSTGASVLTTAARQELQKVISYTSTRERSGASCIAIRVIDSLRAVIQSGKTYRSGRIGTLGHNLDALVVRIDNDIIATGKVKSCVIVGHKSAAIAPQPVVKPVAPTTGKGPAEDQGNQPALRIPKGAKLFVNPGPSSTIIGTKGPAARPDAVPVSAIPRVPPVQIYYRADVGVPAQWADPEEVQVASAGHVVLVSGNDAAFYSTDGGASFAPMSPYTVFGSFQGHLCCDMVLRYSPQVQRFFWLLQGNCVPDCRDPASDGNNSYVLAVSSPSAIRATIAAHLPVERAWHIYRLTRSLFHETSTWFDYPSMAVGDHALYLTWDRVGTGVIMARLNLAQLAAGGDISVYWFSQNGPTFRRLAQNPGATGYWVQNFDDSGAMAAVDYLQESSGLMFEAMLPHTAIPDRQCAIGDPSPTCGYRSLTPMGEDWTVRVAGGGVKAATVRGNQLWVGWTASRGYAGQTTDIWPQPHIQYAAFRIPLTPLDMIATGGGLTWPAVLEGNVWNPNVAIVDPAFATSSNGDIGISFEYGGPANPPSPAAGVIDPLPHELFQVITADSVTAGGDIWQGDWSGIQVDYPNTTRFITSGYVERNDNGIIEPHWAIMCYGRSATAPQPGDRC
ncbi:MAG TPA: hypothetical protein VF834_00680 [Streptosporangiaceae bacterium]